MSDPFPSVAEASATDGTALLFADIRATAGVRVVNLVWRHLATIDGALPWVWSAVKPLYEGGFVDQAVRGFRESMVVPRLAPLAGGAPSSVDDVLAAYDHSNTVNLLALAALAARFAEKTAPDGVPERGPRLPAPDVALPPLASEADVSAETWATVVRLNRFGDRPQPLILASMYRHLAHAPAFLARLETALGPPHADGTLDRAIGANRLAAEKRARVLARAISAGIPERKTPIECAVAAFLDHAIGKMVTICRAVRLARGRP